MKGLYITLPVEGKNKEHLLLFGFKAFEKFKSLTNKSIAALDTDNFEVEDIPKLIWAGLKGGYSVDEVTEMIDESDYLIGEISELIGKAIMLSTTGKETAEVKNA